MESNTTSHSDTPNREDNNNNNNANYRNNNRGKKGRGRGGRGGRGGGRGGRAYKERRESPDDYVGHQDNETESNGVTRPWHAREEQQRDTQYHGESNTQQSSDRSWHAREDRQQRDTQYHRESNTHQSSDRPWHAREDRQHRDTQYHRESDIHHQSGTRPWHVRDDTQRDTTHEHREEYHNETQQSHQSRNDRNTHQRPNNRRKSGRTTRNWHQKNREPQNGDNQREAQPSQEDENHIGNGENVQSHEDNKEENEYHRNKSGRQKGNNRDTYYGGGQRKNMHYLNPADEYDDSKKSFKVFVPKQKAANIGVYGSDKRELYRAENEETPQKKRIPQKRKKEEFSRGHTELTSTMISQIVDGTYTCMICTEKVGYTAAIWTCKQCYHFFHIGCIKKWRERSKTEEGNWACPGCRFTYTETAKARCFCGKLAEVPLNTFLLPHSCGETCGKTREGTTCPHACALLCHPGPCPGCAALAPEKPCFCGKTTYQKRCGEIDYGVSCGQLCGKLLSCGKHNCDEVCHAGPCNPCKVLVTHKCYCGKEEKEAFCGTEKTIDISHGINDIRQYSCGKTCERLLKCGNHTCNHICHVSTKKKSPSCPECPLLPSKIKTCNCGKEKITNFPPRKSCLDPIPSCKNVCGKPLYCGKHTCPLLCHEGPCVTECNELVIIPCRCGNPQGRKEMKCIDVYPDKYKQVVSENVCKRLCRGMRECGRHQCNNRCCPVMTDASDPDGYHVCPLPCKKPLSCGHHVCTLPCHTGRCPPCYEIVSYENRVCPCTKTVQEAPITCGSKPPVCPNPCPKPLACGHTPTPHLCHWTGDCPTCVVLVERMCAGGHTILKSIPCFKTEVFCGRTCNKPMHCNQHNCTRPCHEGPCELPVTEDQSKLLPDDALTRAPFDSCGQTCNKQLVDCRHQCKRQCHPGKLCPVGQCKQKSRIFCSCGRLSEEVRCLGLKQITLPCDDVCKKELRQRQLAEAFGILPTAKPPDYSDFLLNITHASPHFIINIEKQFITFIKSNDTRLKMPPLDSIHRKIVHDYAKYFYFESEMIGVEPNRYLQLSKRPGSRIPMLLLSQILSVEQQQGGDSKQQKKPIVPACTIHIYGLSPKVKSDHVENFLRPYEKEYTLQWIDDANALAIFKNEQSMKKAFAYLSGGLFKVKQYQDSNPTSTDNLGNLSNTVRTTTRPPKNDNEYRQASKSSKPKTDTTTTATWADSNPFALLNESEEFLEPDTIETKIESDTTNSENGKNTEDAATDWEELADDEGEKVDEGGSINIENVFDTEDNFSWAEEAEKEENEEREAET